MIRFAALPLAVMAIACTPAPAVDNASSPAPELAQNMDEYASGACDAEPTQALIGQTLTDAIGRDAQARTGVKSLRVIKPGMAVTMDYRTDRLNIEVDEKGVIATVRCG